MAGADYIIRIELHEKFKGEEIPQSDLDKLHELMAEWDMDRTIAGSKGTYQLMRGMYRFESTQIFKADLVRDAINGHIASINRSKTVLVIRSDGSAWSNLKKVRK